MRALKYIGLFVALIGLSACEDSLDFEPEGSNLEEEDALRTAEDVQALLNSAYESTSGYLNGSFQAMNELLGDNLMAPASNNDLDEVYRHNVLFFNSTVGNYYGRSYNAILKANKVLDEAENFDFSSTELDRIMGESYFIRAMSHFETARLWAQPYGFTSDNLHEGIAYKISTEPQLKSRAAVQDVYKGVIEDLEKAKQMLPPSNGIYANRDAAQALLARVYFQMGEYQKAVDEAAPLIDGGRYSLGTEVDRFQPDVVLQEVIFYFESYLDTASSLAFFASSGFSGYTYRPAENINNPEMRANREFYNTYAGDTLDKRLEYFTVVNEGESNEFIACTKFNEDFFNVPVLHLTELKLIRAEALAELNTDLATARQDLNDIRERAYGSDIRNISGSASASTIIDAVRAERRIEMFGEGSRVQELKRRGAIENENIEVRGDDWDCGGMILQFPISEKSDVFNLNPTGGC